MTRSGKINSTLHSSPLAILNFSVNTPWFTQSGGKQVPTANHRARDASPRGGNFLFEDGHVEWRNFNVNDARGTIDLGGRLGNWLCFYKIPISE